MDMGFFNSICTYILYFIFIWAPSSEFVSSNIPSWQISTAHAQPFRGARDLVFCLKVPLDSLIVWASSEGSGETARMRRLAWTFAARIGDKYQIRLTRSICLLLFFIKQVQFRFKVKYSDRLIHWLIVLRFYSPVNTFKVIDIVGGHEGKYEPHHENTCLQGLRPGKTQTGLLSYRG